MQYYYVVFYNRYTEEVMCRRFEESGYSMLAIQRRAGKKWRSTRGWLFGCISYFKYKLYQNKIKNRTLTARYVIDTISVSAKSLREQIQNESPTDLRGISQARDGEVRID